MLYVLKCFQVNTQRQHYLHFKTSCIFMWNEVQRHVNRWYYTNVSREKHVVSDLWREIPFLFFNIKNSSILRSTVIIALLPYDGHSLPNSSSKAHHSVHLLAISWLELNLPSFGVHFHIDKYTGISITLIFMHGASLVAQWWRICMLMQAMWVWSFL